MFRFGSVLAATAAASVFHITPDPERFADPQPWHGAKTRKWVPKRRTAIQIKRRAKQKAQRLARRKNRHD